MLIAARNAFMAGKRLPYDAEIEYLESTGTQWIDSGVPLKFPISADITLAMVSPYGTLDALPVFGLRYGGGSLGSKFAIWFNKSQRKFALNYGTYDSGYKDPVVQSEQVVNLRTDGAKLYLNGSLIADGGTVITTDAPNTLTLFQMRDISNVAARGQCVRYYSCKIYSNGFLVRDFIPVRVGTTGYLYDRVSGKLFGNAGTGDFVLGPDVVPVEYIESHGTEWIDTGVNAKQSLKIRAVFETNSTSSSYFAYGVRAGDSTITCASGYRQSLGYARWGTSSYVPAVPGGLVDVAQDSSGVIVNGTSYSYNATQTVVEQSGYTMVLFAGRNSATTVTANMVGKFYSCEIWDNGIPVRSFRPVRVGSGSTWEGAMMDVLTRRIYRNAGTGAFTYGNDLKYPIPAE